MFKATVEIHLILEPNADQQGFTSVSLSVDGENKSMRRNSNSSVASDVSFLPRYEASANFYHLQVGIAHVEKTDRQMNF